MNAGNFFGNPRSSAFICHHYRLRHAISNYLMTPNAE